MIMNWDLNNVIRLIRQETDANTIMEKTGIKRTPLQSIVALLSQRDGRFYLVRGLFEKNSQGSNDIRSPATPT
jgi:hypothetical protein